MSTSRVPRLDFQDLDVKLTVERTVSPHREPHRDEPCRAVYLQAPDASIYLVTIGEYAIVSTLMSNGWIPLLTVPTENLTSVDEKSRISRDFTSIDFDACVEEVTKMWLNVQNPSVP